MTTMITGGLGAIGSFVTRILADGGRDVVLYDNRTDTTLIKDVADRITIWQGDLLDLPSVIRAMAENRVEQVIHLAALMPPQCQANPYQAVQINVVGTAHLLEAARIAGVSRFVYACSKSVYGEITGDYGDPTFLPVTEDHPIAPMNVYAATKYAGEQLGLNYSQNWGMDFISLRFGLTFGPGKLTHHGNLGLPSMMIENAMFERPTVIEIGGDQRNDLIYNYDCASAVVAACVAPQVVHRVFNISTGTLTTLKDLAEAVQLVVPGARLEVGPGMDYLGSRTYCRMDITRAREELAYAPQYADLVAAVRHYVETVKQLNSTGVQAGAGR